MTNEPNPNENPEMQPEANIEQPEQTMDSPVDSTAPETQDSPSAPAEEPAPVSETVPTPEPEVTAEPSPVVMEEVPAATEAIEAPVTEAVVEAAADAPAADAPAADAPAADAPVADAPVADAPAADAPAADAPAADAPAADAPAADAAPVTEGEEGQKKSRGKKNKMSDEEAQPIWDELSAAFQSLELLPMTVLRSIPGGAIVDYKGLEGFVPRSQFSRTGRTDPSEVEAVVGQTVEMVVIELGEFAKRKFVCSRRRALRRKRMLELEKNSVVEGVVTSITNYGAFVDLDGTDGLIHITRLSKRRVATPHEVLKVGETVKVRIVGIDMKEERIALSMKEFTESPWAQVEGKYPVGTTVKGKVVNLTDFGAYVELESGVTGMVHISDLSWTKRVQTPSEVVNVGDVIEVQVMDVRTKDRRISLSLRATQPDPWPRLANVFPQDTEANGTVKMIMESGAIVAMDFDIDCFVPRGKMGGRKRRGAPTQQVATVNVGDSVRVKILEMNPERHSMIGAIMRDDSDDRPPRRERGGDEDFTMPHSSPSDNAFRLGDIEGLQKLLNATAAAEPAPAPVVEAPAVVEAAVETPAVTEPVAEAPEVTEPVAEVVVEEVAAVEPEAETVEPVEAPAEEIAADPIAEAPADDTPATDEAAPADETTPAV